MGRALLAAALCLLTLACPVHAKVVGIVFDDSGSMVRSYQTALYTLQVMLASLPEEDRVLMVKMSDPGVPLKIDLRANRQQLLSDIKQWPDPRGWTPYLAVETMLNAVQREIGPGEKGIILIITDGEFLQNPVDGQFTVNGTNSRKIVTAKPCTASLPCAKDLKARYLSFKQQSGEGVEAFFVTLASNASTAQTLRRTVQSQGVRPQLLEVFNGSPTNGAFEVAHRGDIYPTFTRIASRLLESDAGDSNSATWSSNGVEFQSPLPIKRLTLIRSGTLGSVPPPIGQTSFEVPVNTSEELSVGMNKPDAVSAERLQGRVNNLAFEKPLQAHVKHRIAFQGSQAEPGILVLSVDALLRAELVDANGEIILPGADGIYQVDAGQTVQVNAWLESGEDKERVNLCELNGIRFDIHSAFHDQQLGMNVECEVAKRTLSFNARSSGVGTVAVSTALQDYLNARASDFVISVREVRETTLSLQDRPGPDCPACKAQDITLSYKDMVGEDVMLEIGAVVQDEVGDLVYQVDGTVPAGVELHTSSGRVIEQAAPVSLSADETISIVYTSEYQAEEAFTFTLTAEAIRPWSGSARIELRALPTNAPLTIETLGSSMHGQDKGLFEFPLSSLSDGQYLQFELKGLRAASADTAHLKVVSSATRLPLDVDGGEGNTFMVVPRLWFCDCFTSTGNVNLQLEYSNPKTRQSATTAVQLVISAGDPVSRCWQELLGVILFVLLIVKALCIVRTSRFHKKLYIAEFLVTQHGARLEQDGIRAHRWYALLWPLCADERRNCYGGFLFQAQPRSDRVYLVNEGSFPQGLTLDDEPLEDLKNKPLIPFRLGQVLRLRSADGMIFEYELQFIE